MGSLERSPAVNGKVLLVFRGILASVFIVAGILKIVDPGRFFLDIQNYGLFPWNAATIALAFYLPWLEIFCGVAVFIRRLQFGAMLLITTMLVLFIGALVLAWIRGLEISCGCFGWQAGHPHYLYWIIRDVLLLLTSLVLIFTERAKNHAKF